MTARAIPVLMYHHVSPHAGLVTVSPPTFYTQMRWLAEHGYQSITCQDLERFFAGATLPDKSVLITFDDGYLDNYVYAHPVMREFGMHGVIFLITGQIGDDPEVRQHSTLEGHHECLPDCPDHREAMTLIRDGRTDEVMLRWSEVEAMQAAGTFEFHSHTHTHTRWDKTIAEPGARRSALAKDLAASRALLAARTGESQHLCWPQGYYDNDYRAIASANGFRYLYTVKKDINTTATSPEEIGRIVVKDRADNWFGSRMFIYRQPLLGGLYLRLRGE